jgi:hypothetical protein
LPWFGSDSLSVAPHVIFDEIRARRHWRLVIPITTRRRRVTFDSFAATATP